MQFYSLLRLILATSGLISGLLLAISGTVAWANSETMRAQGTSPWCFAFAEEQLIKDRMCVGLDCFRNGNLYMASIFDIALTHARFNNGNGQLPADPKAVFDGSTAALPYKELGVKSYRSSRCTLEQDLFRMTDLDETNIMRFELYPFLQLFYTIEKTSPVNGLLPSEKVLERLDLKKTVDKLRELAAHSSSEDQFIYSILNYSTCNDIVVLPEARHESQILVDKKAIRETLTKVLGQGRSVVAAVCAFTLKYEKRAEKCGEHAVLVKAISGDQVRVVDSAFFSSRGQNGDGSSWIPFDVLAEAISQIGESLLAVRLGNERIVAEMIARYKEDWWKAFEKAKSEKQAALEKSVSDYIQRIQEEMRKLRNLTKKDYVETAKLIFEMNSKEYPLDVAALMNVEINTVEDMVKLVPLITDGMLRKMLENIPKEPPMDQLKIPKMPPTDNLFWYVE